MTSTRTRAWLVNGLTHALRLDRDLRGRVTGGLLLRKSDLKALTVIDCTNADGERRLRPRRRLARLEALALDQLWRQRAGRAGTRAPRPVPGQARHVATLLQGLAVDARVLADYRPPVCVEPDLLTLSGQDRYQRALWLHPETARDWQRMRAAAHADGIVLDAVSGWRSAAYQARLIARKLTEGQTLDRILRISALPGHSEHHLGRALDLHAGTGPVLDETFEHSDAFVWLQASAHRFRFRLSYPRDNSLGIAYEPWHWCHTGARDLKT